MNKVIKTKNIVGFVLFLTLLCGYSFYNPQLTYGQSSLPPVSGQIRTGGGYMTTSGVQQSETQKNVQESTSFMVKTAAKIEDSGPVGSVLRSISGVPNPFTYDSPLTKDFFAKTDNVSGTEMEKISQIYQLTADAVPNYGAPGTNVADLTKLSTFEEVLSCGTGICRDQAGLLNDALKRNGINSRLVPGQVEKPGDHIWVRVKTSTGEEFDLDSTWYKDFIKLLPRKQNPVENKCSALSFTSIFDAIKKKLITFKFFGNGGYAEKSIKLEIDNKTNDFLKIKIPLGLILFNEDSSQQNLVVAKDGSACLSPGDPIIILDGYCANAHKDSPRSGTGLSIGAMAPQELLQVLKDNELNDTHDQRKVWNVTDKLNIDPLSNKIKIWWNDSLKKSSDILDAITGWIKMITIIFLIVEVISYLIYERFILKREKAVLTRIFILLKYLVGKIKQLFKKKNI